MEKVGWVAYILGKKYIINDSFKMDVVDAQDKTERLFRQRIKKIREVTPSKTQIDENK